MPQSHHQLAAVFRYSTQQPWVFHGYEPLEGRTIEEMLAEMQQELGPHYGAVFAGPPITDPAIILAVQQEKSLPPGLVGIVPGPPQQGRLFFYYYDERQFPNLPSFAEQQAVLDFLDTHLVATFTPPSPRQPPPHGLAAMQMLQSTTPQELDERMRRYREEIQKLPRDYDPADDYGTNNQGT